MISLLIKCEAVGPQTVSCSGSRGSRRRRVPLRTRQISSVPARAQTTVVSSRPEGLERARQAPFGKRHDRRWDPHPQLSRSNDSRYGYRGPYVPEQKGDALDAYLQTSTPPVTSETSLPPDPITPGISKPSSSVPTHAEGTPLDRRTATAVCGHLSSLAGESLLLTRFPQVKTKWRRNIPLVGSSYVPFSISQQTQHTSALPPSELVALALRRGDPSGIIRAMMTLISNDPNDIRTLPESTFTEVLRSLQPSPEEDRYAKLLQEFSPAYEVILGVRPPTSAREEYKSATRRVQYIRSIVGVYLQYGRTLTLSHYRSLLSCARNEPSMRTADQFWHVMANAGMAPDLECYNTYLEAICHGDVFDAQSRYNLRVIRRTLEWRMKAKIRNGYHRHSVGVEGIKNRVLHLFNQMTERGISGNEHTIALVITALGREGYLYRVQTMLERVWGINVRLIMTAEQGDIPRPKSYHRDSPLHPSERLLLTLAHTYGTNNAIPTALRLVDYVSRHYGVPISTEVWSELFERTYVLSIRRYSKRLTDGTEVGQLPTNAVGNLWNTFTSKPYNIIPTIAMYDKLIANLIMCGRIGDARQRMEEGKELHIDSVNEFRTKVRHLENLNRALSTSGRRIDPGSQRMKIAHAQRDMEYSQLRMLRNREYLKRWCRKYIRSGSYSLRHTPEFASVTLPRFHATWHLFLPEKSLYVMRTGDVELRNHAKAANKRHVKSVVKRWARGSGELTHD